MARYNSPLGKRSLFYKGDEDQEPTADFQSPLKDSLFDRPSAFRQEWEAEKAKVFGRKAVEEREDINLESTKFSNTPLKKLFKFMFLCTYEFSIYGNERNHVINITYWVQNHEGNFIEDDMVLAISKKTTQRDPITSIYRTVTLYYKSNDKKREIADIYIPDISELEDETLNILDGIDANLRRLYSVIQNEIRDNEKWNDWHYPILWKTKLKFDVKDWLVSIQKWNKLFRDTKAVDGISWLIALSKLGKFISRISWVLSVVNNDTIAWAQGNLSRTYYSEPDLRGYVRNLAIHQRYTDEAERALRKK